jgi:hypothetical protein
MLSWRRAGDAGPLSDDYPVRNSDWRWYGARVTAFVLVLAVVLLWLIGSRNPGTPAGYVGYLTREAVLGKANFIREPLRTFARDEVQRRNGLEVKDALIPIGDAVLSRIRGYAANSPFGINSVVAGNVQYPAEVADAVSRKLAATQELQRKDTEIEIEKKEREKREVQAQGIANAMQIIRGQLSPMYIQHEAIEAQKQMVNSPNHTVVYIPVGPMGVPLTGTLNAALPAPVRK